MEKIFENDDVLIEFDLSNNRTLIHHKGFKDLVMRIDIVGNCIEAQSDNDNGIAMEWLPSNDRSYYCLSSRSWTKPAK